MTLPNEERHEILDDLFIDEKRLRGSFINAESVITECPHESLTTVGAARRFDNHVASIITSLR
jgi:hypothetical protein